MKGNIILEEKEIKDINLKADISKGIIVIRDGNFSFDEEENIYLKTKVKLKNINLEKVDFKIGKNKIKDNFYGNLDLISEIKIGFKKNMNIFWKKTLIKNDIVIEKGKLLNYKPLLSINKYFKNDNLKEVSFSKIATKIMIYNNQVIIPKTEIPSTIGHIYISADLDLEKESKYSVFLPMNLYRKISWNAFFGIKNNNEKEISKEVKEKYIGNYKQIDITETKKEIKIKL